MPAVAERAVDRELPRPRREGLEDLADQDRPMRPAGVLPAAITFATSSG